MKIVASDQEHIPAARFFRVFRGNWKIERVITGSQSGTAKGTATFTETDPCTLAYSERGTLAGIGDFSQKYTFRLEEGLLKVYFSNGESFYTLENRCGVYCCEKDVYTIKYSSLSPDETTFKIECSVLGPKKGYLITTIFTKIITG